MTEPTDKPAEVPADHRTWWRRNWIYLVAVGVVVLVVGILIAAVMYNPRSASTGPPRSTASQTATATSQSRSRPSTDTTRSGESSKTPSAQQGKEQTQAPKPPTNPVQTPTQPPGVLGKLLPGDLAGYTRGEVFDSGDEAHVPFVRTKSGPPKVSELTYSIYERNTSSDAASFVTGNIAAVYPTDSSSVDVTGLATGARFGGTGQGLYSVAFVMGTKVYELRIQVVPGTDAAAAKPLAAQAAAAFPKP